MELRLKNKIFIVTAASQGKPDVIGNTAAFLASDQSNYFNGANLPVDGSAAKGIH